LTDLSGYAKKFTANGGSRFFAPNAAECLTLGVAMLGRGVLWLSGVLLALFPGVAGAGTLTRSGDGKTLTYTDEPGESDALSVFYDLFNPGTLIFSVDPEADSIESAPGSQCGLGGGSGEVACAQGALTRVVLVLGDGADRVAVGSFDPNDSGADFPQPVTFLGGPGADRITGSHQNDQVKGGGGRDTLLGDPGAGTTGNDLIDGGGGSDLVSYATSMTTVRVDLAARTVTGGLGNDKLASVERVLGSAQRDVLLGDRRRNRLAGGDGSDRINGRGGNDRILGEGDSDRLRGGRGRDVCNGGPDIDLAKRDCERTPGVP
jgi:Ca2+-binding RTX toxin-like protein